MPKLQKQTTDQLLLEIAKKHFMIETLETRNSDSLDFHDVSVWGMKSALQDAYEEGMKTCVSHEKLMRSALAHEVYKGDIKTTTIICQTLHSMGLTDSPEYSNSTAMCFEESEPSIGQFISVLNAIGYEL